MTSDRKCTPTCTREYADGRRDRRRPPARPAGTPGWRRPRRRPPRRSARWGTTRSAARWPSRRASDGPLEVRARPPAHERLDQRRWRSGSPRPATADPRTAARRGRLPDSEPTAATPIHSTPLFGRVGQQRAARCRPACGGLRKHRQPVRDRPRRRVGRGRDGGCDAPRTGPTKRRPRGQAHPPTLRKSTRAGRRRRGASPGFALAARAEVGRPVHEGVAADRRAAARAGPALPGRRRSGTGRSSRTRR